MDAIIFDIDGTLSDPRHRQHHVNGGRHEWVQFFDKMVDDPPLRDVCLLAELLGDHPLVNQGAIKLFLCSGRPDTHRKQTEDWLLIHARSYFQKAEGLFMRAAGDYRADTIVKLEMLRLIEGLGYEVRLVVDDRPSVCDMWRKAGLTVLQHDSGDWESNRTWELGDLHLMVGPSCAGKTAYINTLPTMMVKHPGVVISSDALRIEIAGEIGIQDVNAQVFSVIRGMVKARIAGGLMTMVDATNLRARDRRSLRDCCDADTKIFYHVIDRPLNEKLADAGWRKDIMVKGKSLIHGHHQSFRSGLKNILRGDDDPRVTVIDRRRS